MRILFILENYYPNIGGVETLFKSLAESLINHSHKVTVLTNRFDDKLPTYEEINGVAIRRLKLKNRYLFTFLAGFKAIRYAKESDLIHTTSYNAAVPAFIASLFSKKKLVITFHEVWGSLWFRLPFMNKLSLFFHYLFEAFILKFPYHKFIAVSQSTKKALIDHGIKESKIEMIYNGINYDEFQSDVLPSENAEFSFCYFGRLGISKGLDLILEAVRLLKDKNLEFKFTMVLPRTPAKFLKNIKSLVDRYKINEYIEMKHELSFEELKSTVGNSNCVVIPSYSEGFCYSAVETVAMNVPVISSGQAALKEVVGSSYIEMQDLSAESLAEAMERALDKDWEYREPVKFHLSDTVRAYLDFYQSMV